MAVLNHNKKHQKFFEELTQIPRGSYNEKAVSDYLCAFAKERNLRYVQDDMNNVIIYKPASAGCENLPVLMLQSHMDMVCEKNADTEFDFEKDPLKLHISNGWLYASGTTLGADDGAGVAYELALLDDDSLVHPALECVFTVQEEVGLLGAKNLKAEQFKSHYLINLDHGGENSTCVSNSGGQRVSASVPYVREACDWPTYHLFVSGLLGGHSGGMIHKNRANSNKVLGRCMHHLAKVGNFRLVSMEGGLKENAIAREASMVFASDLAMTELEKHVAKLQEAVRDEYHESEPNVSINLVPFKNDVPPMDEASTKRVSDFLLLCPNGLKAMSQMIEDLPTVSLNLGVMRTKEAQVEFNFQVRSPIEPARKLLNEEIHTLAQLCGGDSYTESEYPGWNFDPDSVLRAKLKEVVREINHAELLEEATHGGLECGLFKGMLPELDIVTLGPLMEDIHTPNERLNLESFDKTYVVLEALVESCAK